MYEQTDSLFDICVDAAAGGGVAAAARGGKEGVVDALTRKTGMSLEEACQILNVQKEADLAQLTKVRKTESIMNQSDVLLNYLGVRTMNIYSTPTKHQKEDPFICNPKWFGLRNDSRWNELKS